jgi:YesN/AraC family two-component response regulator
MKKNIFAYIKSLLKLKKRPNSIAQQLSRENLQELRRRLDVLMQEKQPYLKHSYYMKDMADDLHIPAYQLSAFINQVMGVHFTEYMNQFRIDYCQKLIKANPGTKYNLKELAFKCGFRNRNSFATAFKKFTGQRPSHYIKLLK